MADTDEWTLTATSTTVIMIAPGDLQMNPLVRQ